MKKILQYFRREQEGMMALEACVGMTVFMIMMLVIYSLVPLFMAQNMISHALTESCQSLAYETYGTSKLDDGKAQVADVPIELLKLLNGGVSKFSGSPYDKEADAAYTSDERWFDVKNGDYSAVEDVARDRFATYLAGGTEAADRMLENLGVRNGLDGINFSGTRVNGSDLIVSIEYHTLLKIRMDRWGFSGFTSKQQVCSRLWGS